MPKPPLTAFARRLGEAIAREGLSNRTLGQRLDVDRSEVSAWRNARRRPGASRMRVLAEMFRWSDQEVLGWLSEEGGEDTAVGTTRAEGPVPSPVTPPPDTPELSPELELPEVPRTYQQALAGLVLRLSEQDALDLIGEVQRRLKAHDRSRESETPGGQRSPSRRQR